MAITRYYLFVTDTGLTLWQGDAAHLAEAVRFEAYPAGVAEFELLVASQPKAQWHVVLDLQEEDYRIETVPHVNARDRAMVMRRRLDQLYRESHYRSATLQGREPDGRRDDRVLFAALTNRLPLDMWLQPLVKRDAQLVGVYSIALLTARHLRKVTHIPPRALVVSRQAGSGLRQSYLAEGGLRFSRLTVLEGDDHEALANQLAAEAARARQFLASLRAVDRTEALQVVMLCSTTEQAALRAACPDTELLHYHFMPVHQVAHALGITVAPEQATAEPFWLRFVASKRPGNQYATADQRKPHTAWQIGRALRYLSVAILVGTLAAGAVITRQTSALEQQSQVNEQRRQAAERLFAANVPNLKEGELTPSGMKNAVNAYRTLVEQWPALEGAMRDVATVMARFPMAELDEMGWLVGSNPAELPQGFATPGQTPAPVPAADPNAVDVNGMPLAPPPGKRYVIVAIKARLLGYEDRYREALALVDQIAAAFVLRPDVVVEKITLPIDIRPEASVKLGGDSAEQVLGAPFSLKFVIPLTPPTPAEAAS